MNMAKFIFIVFLLAFLAIIVISITLSGSFEKFIQNVRLALVHGQFQIIGEPPTVRAIFLEHFSPTQDFANCTDTYTDCWTEPNESSTSHPTIKVMIRDGNANCDNDALFHVYVDICKPGMGACDFTNSDRTVELNFDSQGSDTAYCNYSYQGPLLGFDYFEAPGDWGIYTNVTDGTFWNSNEPFAQRFQYTYLAAFKYPGYGDTVNMGTLSLGAWNNGTGDSGTDPTSWNTGNVEQDVMWNASDYSSGSDTLQITDSNYIMDDDKDGTDDTGNLEQVYMNDSSYIQAEFPKTNLKVCNDFVCSSPSDAMFNIYWHIYIPSGQAAGTYSNDITITNSQV